MPILEVLPRFEVVIFVVFAAVTTHLWILLRREQRMMKEIKNENEEIRKENETLRSTVAELRDAVSQRTKETEDREKKIKELREQIERTHRGGKIEVAVMAALAVAEAVIRFWQ